MLSGHSSAFRKRWMHFHVDYAVNLDVNIYWNYSVSNLSCIEKLLKKKQELKR